MDNPTLGGYSGNRKLIGHVIDDGWYSTVLAILVVLRSGRVAASGKGLLESESTPGCGELTVSNRLQPFFFICATNT